MAQGAIKIHRLILMIEIGVKHALNVKINRFGLRYPKIQIRLIEYEFTIENCVQIKSGQPCPDSI